MLAQRPEVAGDANPIFEADLPISEEDHLILEEGGL
jgi:hypothetical protein